MKWKSVVGSTALASTVLACTEIASYLHRNDRSEVFPCLGNSPRELTLTRTFKS